MYHLTWAACGGAVRAKGTLCFSVWADRQILSSETLWNHFKLENSGSHRQTSRTWTEMWIKAETEWTDSNSLVCTYTLCAPPIKRTSPDISCETSQNTNTCSWQQKWATYWFKWILLLAISILLILLVFLLLFNIQSLNMEKTFLPLTCQNVRRLFKHITNLCCVAYGADDVSLGRRLLKCIFTLILCRGLRKPAGLKESSPK